MKKLIALILFVSVTAYAATKVLQGDTWKSADLTKTWTPPTATDTLVGLAATQTVTAKTMRNASGTVGAPSHSFSADTDNGLYYLAANNWAASVGGVKALDFVLSTGSLGNLGIGGNASTSDLYPMLAERNNASPIIFQLSNPNSTAGAGIKIQGSVSAGANGAELGLFSPATAAPDAYAGGNMTLRSTGTTAGISYVADDSGAYHKFYVAGNAIGNKVATFSATGLALVTPLALTSGGSAKSLTAVNGGVVWSDADSMEVSAAGSAAQVLVSTGAAAPVWGTPFDRNLIEPNSQFETGTVGTWVSYADAAGLLPVDGTGGAPTVTCTYTAVTPLSGVGSLLVTQPASNTQGEGCSSVFTIDTKDRGRLISVSFDYTISTGTNGDGFFVVSVYDVTNAALITPVLPTTNFGGTAASTYYTYNGNFTASATSSSYRLIIHRAATGTSAATIRFDNFKVKPDPIIAPWYINAYFTGGNPDLGLATVSAYTEIVLATLTLTPTAGTAAVGTMCSAANAATAPSTSTTTCAAGSESVGINFVVPSAGAYEVCAAFSHFTRTDTGESIFSTFQIIETPTNAQTLTLEGGQRTSSGMTGMAIAGGTNAENYFADRICGIFNWSSGSKGVRLMYEQDIGGVPNASTVLCDESAPGRGQRQCSWTVKRLY